MRKLHKTAVSFLLAMILSTNFYLSQPIFVQAEEEFVSQEVLEEGDSLDEQSSLQEMAAEEPSEEAVEALIEEQPENTEENRKNPNYAKYVDAYRWLLNNYDDVESLFCSPEFYFRAGYVAGYGVYKPEDDELYW